MLSDFGLFSTSITQKNSMRQKKTDDELPNLIGKGLRRHPGTSPTYKSLRDGLKE